MYTMIPAAKVKISFVSTLLLFGNTLMIRHPLMQLIKNGINEKPKLTIAFSKILNAKRVRHQ